MSNSPFNPPLILTREQWHCPGPVGPKMNLPAKLVFLHHSVTPTTGNPVADAQGVAHVGIERFGRLSYSGLVHPARVIFHGQTEHRGAHTENFNSVALGLCLIGNYEAGQVPDSLVYDACVLFHAWRSVGLLIDRPLVLPHDSVKATACPGSHAIEKVLPFLRAVAADPSWRP